MRVLFLTQNIAGRGGTYARCRTLARGLASRGHEVTILAASTKKRARAGASEAAGVRVVEMPSLLPQRFRHGGLSLLDLTGRILHMLRNEFDLVHCFDHRPTVSLPALFFSRTRKRPCVADWCDLWGREGLGGLRRGLERMLLTPADDRLERWVIKRATGVTAVSTHLARRARELREDSGSILLLPPSANDDVVYPEPMDAARSRHAMPPDVPVLVFSGYTRLGAELLGEAFARVARRHPTALLLTIGGPLPHCERILSACGLTDRVVHVGAKPYEELGGFLACGDVMLLPYPDHRIDRAGFANKLADYLAAGRPVATNRTGDLGRMVGRERVGVATADDPEAYAEGICTLLDEPALRREMGVRARRLAETSFSFRSRAKELEEFYFRLI